MVVVFGYICHVLFFATVSLQETTFKKQQKATEKTVLLFEILTAVFRPSSKSWCIEILKTWWKGILLLGTTWKGWKRKLLAGTSSSFCCCRFFCSLGKQIVESRFLQKYIVPDKRVPVIEGELLLLLGLLGFFLSWAACHPAACFIS